MNPADFGKNPGKLSADNLALKAAWQPQAIFFAIWGGMSLMTAVRALASHHTGMLGLAAFFGLIAAAWIAFFQSYGLRIDRDSLLYRMPLNRSIAVPLADIRSVSYKFIELGKRRSYGVQAMIIELRDESASPVVFRDVRAFPNEGLKQLNEILATRDIAVIA